MAAWGLECIVQRSRKYNKSRSCCKLSVQHLSHVIAAVAVAMSTTGDVRVVGPPFESLCLFQTLLKTAHKTKVSEQQLKCNCKCCFQHEHGV